MNKIDLGVFISAKEIGQIKGGGLKKHRQEIKKLREIEVMEDGKKKPWCKTWEAEGVPYYKAPTKLFMEKNPSVAKAYGYKIKSTSSSLPNA